MLKGHRMLATSYLLGLMRQLERPTCQRCGMRGPYLVGLIWVHLQECTEMECAAASSEPASGRGHSLAQARLAQSAERKALNLVVVGSSPTVGVGATLIMRW